MSSLYNELISSESQQDHEKYRAFDQWAERPDGATLAELTNQALDELLAAAAGLVTDSRPADGSSDAPPTA